MKPDGWLRHFFAALAFLIFLALGVVHVASLGGNDVRTEYPWAQLLEFGGVVTIFPALLLLKKLDLGRNARASEFAPLPMTILLYAALAYGGYNVLQQYSQGGSPQHAKGQYFVMAQGRTEIISAEEYRRRRAVEFRLSTAVPMVVSLLAFTILAFSEKRVKPPEVDATA